jgi:hypothetical protein
MPQDDRNVLDVLKFELNYLEKGGYGRSPREWRAPLVFEDSPTCMNYDTKDHPRPCAQCVLMQFVPPEQREKKIPCRQIQLTPGGDTLDTLYRWADQHEIEEAMRGWLESTIERLESQMTAIETIGPDALSRSAAKSQS